PRPDVAAAVDSFRAPVPVIMIAARDRPGDGDPADRVLPSTGALGAPGAILPIAVDQRLGARLATEHLLGLGHRTVLHVSGPLDWFDARERETGDRKSTRLNSSHVKISYAVSCLKTKNNKT